MQKNSIMQANGSDIFKSQQLTIDVDLGDHFSSYCILDEAGEILREQKLPTTQEKEACRARREKRQEASGSGSGAKASGTPSPVVGEWGGLRTAAQQPKSDEHSSIRSLYRTAELERRV